jgi:hypothetical protein
MTMIRRLPTLGLVLLALSGFSAGAAVSARQAVSVGTNGALASPTNFFRANIGPLTNALSEVPIASPRFTGAHSGDGSALTGLSGDAIGSGTVADARIPSTIARTADVSALASNRVSKAGDTMTGSLAIAVPGVGMVAIGSTNNPAAPAVVLSYDGTLFELGDGSVDPIGLNNTWLVVSDSGFATWSIPMAMPSLIIGTTNVIEAIGGKQPYASPLVALATNNAAAVTNLNASELRSGTVPNARLAANLQVLATNGVSGPLTLSATEAPGSSNRIAATTEFVAKALHNVTGGGGTGNADTNSANGWSQRQTFAGGIDAPGTNNLGVIHVTGIESDTAIDQSIGGTGGTDAESARAALGLQYDVDVQAYYPALKQLALAMLAEGHMAWRNAAGVVTNTPSLAFGRSVLNTADAAAVRALIGAVYGAGDTMSGPLLVPYIGIVAGHTNVGSNQVATLRAVAEVEQRVSVGGFISSVSSDFENVAGQLLVTNTTGTGPILRRSAAGTNAEFAGLADVEISNPVAGQAVVYNGSKWRNGRATRMDTADQWVEYFTGIFGGSANLAVAMYPFTYGGINSGVTALLPTYAGRNGVFSMATAASTATFTGASINFTSAGTCLDPTNELAFRTEFIWVITNSVIARLGFGDQFNTNLPTDCVQFAATNGLVVGEASQGGFGNRTQTATSFLCGTNIWYVAKLSVTNSTAWFRLYTNRTQLAWEDSVASNVPGTGQLVGPGVAFSGTAADSTNKVLAGVDTYGFGHSVQ